MKIKDEKNEKIIIWQIKELFLNALQNTKKAKEESLDNTLIASSECRAYYRVLVLLGAEAFANEVLSQENQKLKILILCNNIPF